MSKDNFGDRIKSYEAVWDQTLPARLPVILRLDGNSFHNFTRDAGFQKPFDDRMLNCMVETTRAVMEYCSGAVFGYTQSDEITILLLNDQTPESDTFLGNRVQKITSLTAAVASVAFNRAYQTEVRRSVVGQYTHLQAYGAENADSMPTKLDPDVVAHFDCRAFVVPHSEVNNTILWRQADAFKNCISAYAYYRLKEKYGKAKATKMLQGLTTKQRQEVIFQEFQVNPNDLPTRYKRGIGVYRKKTEAPIEEVIPAEKYQDLLAKGHIKPGQVVERNSLFTDYEIPRFNQDPEFIGKYLVRT